jgi:hypothetical protein
MVDRASLNTDIWAFKTRLFVRHIDILVCDQFWRDIKSHETVRSGVGKADRTRSETLLLSTNLLSFAHAWPIIASGSLLLAYPASRWHEVDSKSITWMNLSNHVGLHLLLQRVHKSCTVRNWSRWTHYFLSKWSSNCAWLYNTLIWEGTWQGIKKYKKNKKQMTIRNPFKKKG